MAASSFYSALISRTIMTTFLLFLILHSMSRLRCCYYSHVVAKYKKSLDEVSSQMDTLLYKHNHILLKIKTFPGLINESCGLSGLNLEFRGPTNEYESVRRRIYSNIKELWYYLKKVGYYFDKAFMFRTLTRKGREAILHYIADVKRLLLSDQERMPALDGYEEWRRREAASVSDLVQRRLYHLQNPANCSVAKKIICTHDRYGLGCNLHHLVHCLVTAYAFKRTMLVMRSNEYHTMHAWRHIFSPVSETCTKCGYRTCFHNLPVLSEQTMNESVVLVPCLRRYDKPLVRPFFIPKDLAPRIARFSGDPYAWWIGQIVKYIIKVRRPNVISASVSKINWTLPIVGVHIRRTDKTAADVKEADFFHIHEYMSHVEDYYAQLEITRPVQQRRVYLATDDVDVLKQAIKMYPQYTFYGDYIKASIAYMTYRYTTKGFSGTLVDLYMLSLCDFVVCTWSSNIGRMAYELMQTRRTDATNRFVSLDHMYYFSMGDHRYRTAVMSNKNNGLLIGDQIKYKCLHGRNDIGTNSRTRHVGRIPWHKTEEQLVTFSYPNYKEVPLRHIDTDANLTACVNHETCIYKFDEYN